MADTPMTGTTVDHEGWEVDSFGSASSTADAIKTDLSDGEELPASEPAEGKTPRQASETATADPTTADTDGDETDADETADAATAQPATDKPTDKPTDAKKKTAAERKKELQAEINALTRAKYEEQRAVEAIRRQRGELEAPPQARERPAPATAAADAPKKPVWADFDAAGKSFDDYVAAYDTYLEARVESKIEQDRKTRTEHEDRTRREAQHRTVMAQYHTRLEKARAAHEDFDAVVAAFDAPRNAFLTDAVFHHEQGPEILYQLALHKDDAAILGSLPLTNPMMDAFRETEAPAELLLYFARHPEKTEAIARLHPRSALVALGKLVAQVEGGAKNGSPPPASVSRAKPPIGHLSGSRPAAAAASGDARDDDPDEDILDYITRKNAADSR